MKSGSRTWCRLIADATAGARAHARPPQRSTQTLLLCLAGLIVTLPVSASADDCVAALLGPRLREIPGFETVRLVTHDEGAIAVLRSDGDKPVLLGIGIAREGPALRIVRRLVDGASQTLNPSPALTAEIGRIAASLKDDPAMLACPGFAAQGGGGKAALDARVAAECDGVRREIEAQKEAAARAPGPVPEVGIASAIATDVQAALRQGVAYVLEAARFLFCGERGWPLYGDRILFPLVFVLLPVLLAVRALRRSRRDEAR